MTVRRTRLLVAAGLFACCSAALPGAETVILKDGFVIQGNIHKETEVVSDKATGTSVRIVKANGLDMIDEGPKVTVFSTHARQLGAISADIKLRPEYKAYKVPFAGRKGNNPLPPIGGISKITDFNSKWVRTLTVPQSVGPPVLIDEQVTHLDPYFIYVVSATHLWRSCYRTTEWDPKVVRKMLMMHPELAEPDGKCVPLKRVALAKFMLDAGWLQFAKDEMDRLKKDFTGELLKEDKEAHEKLSKEIDEATAELVVREAELALGAGRYAYATDLLAVFPEKGADPKEVARAAKAGADLKTAQERYDAARRLLGNQIDAIGGRRGLAPLLAAGGGGAAAAWRPVKEESTQAVQLAAAAGRVFNELHPDSAIRIETFVTLAAQAERERAMNREPTKKPDELIATAISGWAMGRNGATPNVDAALKAWASRELILAYQKGETPGARTELLGKFKKSNTLGIDQLAQLISLLPPVDPEDLDKRTGKRVDVGANVTGAVYRRKTGPAPGHATGIEYLVKLPPEYHHGRAYPVLIVLAHSGNDPETALSRLVTESDKHGYILIAPEWTAQFNRAGWEWRGEDHVYVTAALRDAVRHFTVDNDRVFLCGVGDGANMAMDVGSSHPDLFAGVIPVAPNPKWLGHFIEAWRNAQKLPFYIVAGELGGDSVKNLREIFLKWMPQGFPAVMSIYKGRGIEWYSAETPVIFDWMSRKTRVNGTATLALGTYRQPWIILRESDNRFYWLQTDQVRPGKSGGAPVPATVMGDIRGNNLIDIKSERVKHLTVWLSTDMIDWTKPVRVQLNGSVARDWPKPKPVEPNLEVMLEDYAERGDRRMLFLNKIELGNIP